MGKALDLVGKKFGRLTVLSKGNSRPNARSSIWNCICECGRVSITIGSNLVFGNTNSCGCLVKENGKGFLIHGKSKTEEYKLWKNIKNRCLNKNNADYHNYGGKGITICNRWAHSFNDFVSDMGKRPSPTHILKRLDTNGNFDSNNCHWVNRPSNALTKESKEIDQLGWKNLSDYFNIGR